MLQQLYSLASWELYIKGLQPSLIGSCDPQQFTQEGCELKCMVSIKVFSEQQAKITATYMENAEAVHRFSEELLIVFDSQSLSK